MRLLEVTLGGEPLDVSALDDGRLPLTGLQASNELVVRAVFACSHTGEGLHRFVDPQDDGVYLYTQAFLDDAPRFLACFDQPDLKAEWRSSITAPPHWVVLANTRGRSTAPGRWVFDRTKPLPPYLVALAAGDYEGVREQHDGIDVGVWARRSMVGFLPTERMLETTRRGLDWFHGLFGVRYPFGKYDQVMVPEFNAGAMENPGLVTFRDEHYLPRGAVTEEDRLEPGLDPPARDGAHVVRRPGDHALVGRPVAERVVRRVPGVPGGRGGRRLRHRVDDVPGAAQGLGLPRRPPVDDAPGRPRSRRRHRRRAAELRRHLVRQGRVGAAPPGGVAGRRGVLRCGARALPPARVRQRDAGRPGRRA
nr:M1 family aminopeptidase [Angustibacter aerolatus]